MTKSQPTPRWNRRAFLQAVAAGSATLAAAPEAPAFSLLSKPEWRPPERLVPSYCELCFWKCGLIAEVRKNRILALHGHPDYPNARGKLCGRGQAGAAAVVDEDRLKYPMVRVGERGAGKFERVGWKQAYQRIAEGFGRIKQEHGAQALALFYHGAGGAFLRTLFGAYGSPNFAGPSYAQCKGPRDVGYTLTFGEKLPTPEPLDFEHTRCMVFFGSHLGENAHNSQVQQFVAAKARGASLIVLDPRLSTAAGRADVWLPIRPGADLAVILAWIHLLLTENAFDTDFVRTYTVGLEALRAHIRDFTPQWAGEQAGVPTAEIVRAYELIRAARPQVLIHPGRHATWYGMADTQRARGQAILTALLGAWWTQGGIFHPAKPQVADYPTPDLPDLPADVDHAAGRFPFAQEVTTNGIRSATCTGKPYPIKGWFVYGTNLIQSMPDMRETIQAIANLDLLVVCDILPMEIVRYADVVLPEDVYLERFDDLSLGAGKQPYIGLRQPVVRSPYDTRPAWRIAKELGQHLGVGDFFAFDTFEQYLETRLQAAGTSLEQLRKDGVFLPPGQHAPYLDRLQPASFHTPTGKIELYSQQLADKGFDPLPVYKPQAEPPAGQFRLLYGRSPLHSFGRTQNNPILSDVVPHNRLWLHPRPAAALGLQDGQPVLVANDRGDEAGPLPLHVTERLPEGVVYMVHGFGHHCPDLARADAQGGADSDVIATYVVDPISGSTGMRTQFVTVRPAGPAPKEG